jgi:feruloyl-CoA synthase
VRTGLGGGAFTLHHPEPLGPYARCIGDWLEQWARDTPDAPSFAEPSAAGGWAVLNWRELRRQVGAVAQRLLDLDLPPGRPVVILSDNALHHLVLTLAALHVGRAVCAVSSGYCRLAQGDFGKIHGILRTLEPALVYASDAAVYAPALVDCGVPDALRVFSRGADTVPGAQAFEPWLDTAETAAVRAAFLAITPDTEAKYLLTSGSTGTPKVVINTHRMLCANQQMLAQTWRFLERERPVLLDWLPWSHTFGANHNIGHRAAHGGTMYIDDGRPMPGLVDRTLAHLREVQPTLYFNVPRGYEMMLPALEADDELARRFFGPLKMLFYAGAAMPEATWRRLEAVARRVRAEPVWFTTSWGSTETAPAITSATGTSTSRASSACRCPARRAQVRAQRRQARDAHQGRPHLHRLPPQRRRHARGLRRGRLVPHRRRGLPGRRCRPRVRRRLRRPRRRGLQARQRHLGQSWACCACAWSPPWRLWPPTWS